MRRSDFTYELPPHLIAQEPPAQRGAGRLLCLDGATGAVADRRFRELPQLLRPGDLLVINDTRVMPARLFGSKASGGRVEVLVERIESPHRALAQVRASKSPRAGSRLHLEDGVTAEVESRRGSWYVLRFLDERPLPEILERHGHMPLPPYIRRPDAPGDRERYQTVYARSPGAVAAPTAGLHFDHDLFAALEARGVERACVTLHVGAGTFQPVRVERLEEHRMHPEYAELGAPACARIREARARGGRVVAVGTTVARTLESAATEDGIAPFQGETTLFIRPGYRFRAVDLLLTNFHLPESTLLMLVCAFGGYGNVMAAYRHAVREEYRFYSYGDAMLIERAGD